MFPGSVLGQRHIYLTSANANLVDKNMNTLSCLIFGCSIIIAGVIVARFNTKTPPNGGEGKFKNPLKNINVIIVVVTLAFALNQVSLAKCKKQGRLGYPSLVKLVSLVIEAMIVIQSGLALSKKSKKLIQNSGDTWLL